jgi:hypothetical protein
MLQGLSTKRARKSSVQKIPIVSCNMKVHCRVHESSQRTLMVNQLNLMHILKPCYYFRSTPINNFATKVRHHIYDVTSIVFKGLDLMAVGIIQNLFLAEH